MSSTIARIRGKYYRFATGSYIQPSKAQMRPITKQSAVGHMSSITQLLIFSCSLWVYLFAAPSLLVKNLNILMCVMKYLSLYSLLLPSLVCAAFSDSNITIYNATPHWAKPHWLTALFCYQFNKAAVSPWPGFTLTLFTNFAILCSFLSVAWK